MIIILLIVKFLKMFYQSKQLTDYIYTNIYYKISKCIKQTPCSYEHYLVHNKSCTVHVASHRSTFAKHRLWQLYLKP